MCKYLVSILTFILLTSAFAETGLEGKVATLTLELKGLTQNNELTASALIKDSVFATGLFFEPKNKEVNLHVPGNCRSLVELAFQGSHKFTIRGELKAFEERFTAPTEVFFIENKSVQCSVVRSNKQ